MLIQREGAHRRDTVSIPRPSGRTSSKCRRRGNPPRPCHFKFLLQFTFVRTRVSPSSRRLISGVTFPCRVAAAMLRTPAGQPGQRILTEGCLSRSLWWTFWSGRCPINPLTCLHLHLFINEHLRFAASLATTFLVIQGSGWYLFPSFRITFSLFFNGKCASKTWPKQSFGQMNFFLLFKWHHAARERMWFKK